MRMLVTDPNIEDPDGFYAKLIDLQERCSNGDSAEALNARLVLILANHIGDKNVLRQAFDLAAKTAPQSGSNGEEGKKQMKIDRIHHAAYRCRDARETVEWYRDNLNMDFVLAIAEDQVPSTGEPDPYMHVFLDAGSGNVLAFFELPTKPEMGKDPNTPDWVQHIAFKVKDRETLLAYREHLEAGGIDVLGVTDHSIFHSIYFFDPNGHRLELACPDPNEEEKLKRLDGVKWDMLEEWSRTKRAPKHADWMHKSQSSGS